MTTWRQSRFIVPLVFGVFLVIQLAVPISRLGSDTPQRFGWQMYSATEPSPEFTVSTPDGDVSIDVVDYTAAERAEIDYEGLLPPHLCAVIPDAVAITWDEGSYRC